MLKMRLLLVHGGRVSRALDFQPMRHALTGRRWWKYHASCSVNLLKCRTEITVRLTVGAFEKSPVGNG
jgi:hypothetical protein